MDVDSGKGLYRCATQGALGFKQKWSRVRAKMKVILALNRATSRRSGVTSRRSREESSQRRDVRANVATFGPTSRRSGQRRDVLERGKNQRRDIEIQRRDVPEGLKINVATF